MSTPYVILELKMGRDSESYADVAEYFYSSLPQLQDDLIRVIVGNTENISLEIVAENQTISFYCYCPERLNDYVQSILIASYPQILINQISYDPLLRMLQPQAVHEIETPHHLVTAELKLKKADYYPLKTYSEFGDTDALSALLSTLSKFDVHDKAIIQHIVSPLKDTLFPTRKTSFSTTNSDGTSNAHPQKAMIEKKLAFKQVRSSIRILVSSNAPDRANQILESIGNTYQLFSINDGNQFKLEKPFFFKFRLLDAIQERHFSFFNQYQLSTQELATLYHLPSKKVSIIPNIAWGKTLLGEPPENLPIISRDSTPEVKKNTNVFAKAMYKNKESIYGIKRTDRRRHMYVIGKTGTGKSTLLANMAINDLKNGEGLCVIDPHGDLVETLLDYIPAHRINDVVYFNPSDPEKTVQINLFEGKNVAHRELIASGIISIFQKLYGYSWGPRLEYILRNALLTLLTIDNARMSDIMDLLVNAKFREKMIGNLQDPILKSFWFDEYNKLNEKQRTESIAPILNKVGQFVSSPLIRNVVNAHKSSFSIEEIMDDGKILLVNLSQGRLGEDNATLLGAMLITKIQLAAMARVHTAEESRRDFYLYVDEFQNFATGAFNKILSEARKYRLNLILANQYIAQIPEDVQKAIFGNCGSMISFVMGADDAQAFQREFGGMYTPDDLVSLSKYQVINKLTIDNIISKPFPGQTLELAKSRNQNRDKVIRVSRERYAKTT